MERPITLSLIADINTAGLDSEALEWTLLGADAISVSTEPHRPDHLRATFLDRPSLDAALSTIGVERLVGVAENTESWQERRRRDQHEVQIETLCFGPVGFTPPDGLTPIRLQLDGAFGDAGHPTTRLVVQRLLARPPSGRSVLDVGTGTGVLAIVSALGGASRVTAIDIDSAACDSARNNARHNRVEHLIEVLHSSGLSLPAHDLVVANITADHLVGLAPDFERWVAPNGDLWLTGIIDERLDDVTQAMVGFTVERRHRSEGWNLLEMRAR